MGAIASIITGFVVSILWMVFLTDITGIYEIIPGFILSLIVAVLVSLFTRHPSKEVTDLFDAVQKTKEIN